MSGEVHPFYVKVLKRIVGLDHRDGFAADEQRTEELTELLRHDKDEEINSVDLTGESGGDSGGEPRT